MAEWERKPVRLAEATHQAGREMKEQQRAAVEAFHRDQAERPLTQPCEPPPDAPANAPAVVAVEIDGGRIRTRNENCPRGVTNPHWREFQAGCAVRLHSKVSSEDPRPEVPSLFLDRPKVHRLVSQLHRQRRAAADEATDEATDEAADRKADKAADRKNARSIGQLLAEAQLVEDAPPAGGAASGTGDSVVEASVSGSPRMPKRSRPKRLMRTCVATLEGADACGRILAAEAASRGFDQAARKAFVADGQRCNWSVWKRYFRRQGYVPIADFIHLLSYVYALAMSAGSTEDEGWQQYVRWLTALWEGRAAEVLAEWQALAERMEIPSDDALPDSDPRRPIQRGVTYLRNNLGRVDYPRYRRLGLPVTSTLMESLVKEFNARVKGTEKFWTDPAGAEAILTVRAALLSEDDRFNRFFATRPGCRYRRRSTLQRQHQPAPAPATAG